MRELAADVKQELQTLKPLNRACVYTCIAFLFLQVLQGALILPFIIMKYGWGYSAG
jgi:aminoglycoside phosphotransferase (APT) family kinase protein